MLLIFVIIQPKPAHMGWQFQGSLKQVFHFKIYFHVFGIFLAGCISAFKNIKESKALNKIRNTFVAFQ